MRAWAMGVHFHIEFFLWRVHINKGPSTGVDVAKGGQRRGSLFLKTVS